MEIFFWYRANEFGIHRDVWVQVVLDSGLGCKPVCCSGNHGPICFQSCTIYSNLHTVIVIFTKSAVSHQSCPDLKRRFSKTSLNLTTGVLLWWRLWFLPYVLFAATGGGGVWERGRERVNERMDEWMMCYREFFSKRSFHNPQLFCVSSSLTCLRSG